MPMKLRCGKLLEEIPIKRARLAKNCSTGWFDLPFEMREMIIDRMDVKTRCRFAICSKLCEKEAKESKYYMSFMHVKITHDLEECVVHINHNQAIHMGHYLRFKDLRNGQTSVEYRRHGVPIGLIRIETGNGREVIDKYVKEYLQRYKNSLRSLKIEDSTRWDIIIKHINLSSFRNLVNFDFYCERWRNVNMPKMVGNAISVDKILRLDHIQVPFFNLTFDQIVNFRGKRANMQCDEMTSTNVKKYLKLWKNEEIHEKIEEMCIDIACVPEKDVDLDSIVEGLNVIKMEKESIDSILFSFMSIGTQKSECMVFYEPGKCLKVMWSRPFHKTKFYYY